MQLHDIKPKIKKKSKKRVGRGGKRGAYSGRGQKGQKSRAGRRIRPQIRDTIKKIPKKRGYKFKSFKKKPVVINVGLLEKKLSSGDEVNPRKLLEAGLIKKISGKMPKVKLLGDGTLAKKFLVSECQISKLAKEKIEKAGGEIKLKNKIEKIKTTT